MLSVGRNHKHPKGNALLCIFILDFESCVWETVAIIPREVQKFKQSVLPSIIIFAAIIISPNKSSVERGFVKENPWPVQVL